MDAWSSEQLKKMQLGGNDALNTFLKKYGVDKHTDIKDKYNSPAAEVLLFIAAPLPELAGAYTGIAVHAKLMPAPGKPPLFSPQSGLNSA